MTKLPRANRNPAARTPKGVNAARLDDSTLDHRAKRIVARRKTSAPRGRAAGAALSVRAKRSLPFLRRPHAPEERRPVWREPLGVNRRAVFGDLCGAHPGDRVGITESGNDLGQAFGRGEDLVHDYAGLAPRRWFRSEPRSVMPLAIEPSAASPRQSAWGRGRNRAAGRLRPPVRTRFPAPPRPQLPR